MPSRSEIDLVPASTGVNPQITAMPGGGRASISRRALLVGTVAGGALLTLPRDARAQTRAAGTAVKNAGTAASRHIRYTSWTGVEFVRGRFNGVNLRGGQLSFGRRTSTAVITDEFAAGAPATTYDVASWTSPWVTPGFDIDEVVASWNAQTPGASFVEIVVRARVGGRVTKDYILGRWCEDDPAMGGGIHRTSVDGQGDADANIYTDTFSGRTGVSIGAYQLELRLHRPAGSNDRPTVSMLGAMCSALFTEKKVPRSPNGVGCGTVIDVPTYSQEVHIGHYPEWDNGGEAWCSATSTAMVVDHWGAGPSAQETSWVDPPEDAQVDFTARQVYDYTYDGAGNWPFNTAYAASRGLTAFITRLRSLTEAEQFIAAGIPIIVSVSFKKSELPNAGYGTNGHLMVIVGFTEGGDVVCNDPASHLIPSNDEVRVVYDRTAFENVWIPRTAGIAYVITPTGYPLPRAPREANW